MDLLERASFLATLEEYAGDARRGDGRLVLISGESGMGKTALLEEYQRRGGERWLWGACDGLLTPRPLGPLFDIGAQSGGDLAELCQQDASRDQLFRAFQAEIDSPDALTIAVIEDVHWADEATIDLLSFLGRRLARMRTLLLVTFREDEIGDDHPLRIMLGDLATQRATRRIQLPPLSQEAIRVMVGDRDLDAAELRRVTGGNPFYVSEIVAAGWPSVPPTVRDAVGARMARSTPGTRRAVEAAAVAGSRVDRSLLIAALAGSFAAVDESVTIGLLVRDGPELRFRHELVRMAVETAIAPHRKAELHARLLALLEERDRADPAVLAHHAEGAADAAAVLRHAPAAARRSAALGAHREAAAQFERALRFADGSGTALLAALHEGVAREYSLLDRWDESDAELQQALRMRRELGDPAAVGELLCMLSTAMWRLCRGKESEQAAREAVATLETLPPGPELGRAYAVLGATLMPLGEVEAGLATLAKAKALGETLDEPGIVSYALNGSGYGLAYTGRDGLAAVTEALRIALDAGLEEHAGRAYSSLEELAVTTNDFAAAERFFGEGMAYCEERELGVFTWCMHGWRSFSMLQQGRWDEAAETCEHMLSQQGVSPVNRLNPVRVLGTVRGRRGEDGAWTLADEALALAEGVAETPWIVPVRVARAELRYLSGQPEQAAAEVQPVAATRPGVISSWTHGDLAIWLARLGVPGTPPASLPEPFARELSGDWAGAMAAWQRLGRPYEAALVALIAGDEDALRQALATFDEMGAGPAATATRRRMRELGVRSIPRGPRPATKTAPAGLTAREQEVLALLSEGLANQEISQRLFISQRTVDHHVSAVLAKIGVSSRAAAAREASRLGIGSPG
jgi:DNA-binding CsgD family transcriptional regulator/tetratricopeptide (TPR) repeat protein